MLMIDRHEPQIIYDICARSVDAVWMDLNIHGHADYMWAVVDGHMVSIERKQWTEILSDVPGVEDQLRRELERAQDLTLLIEGNLEITSKVIKPVGKRVDYEASYGALCAWLWSLDKAGITIVQVPDQYGTACWLVAAYKQGQKSEHTVLERYTRVKKQTSCRDPLVLTLMGIQGAGLGEIRAKALAARFASLYELVVADVEDIMQVEGFGEGLARKVLKAVGRGYS